MDKDNDPIGFSVTEYVNEVDKYLASKLPEIPDHVRMEITAYIGHRTSCLITDSIMENNRERSRAIKRRN